MKRDQLIVHFFVEGPSDDQSEELKGAFYARNEQKGSREIKSRPSSSKQGSSS